MKILNLCFASLLLLSAANSHAGSFGPPPFTNGSPLPTGMDGSYQATLRGQNTAGVVGFAYSDGRQTSLTSANYYVIFSEGLAFFGFPQVNLMSSTISGVFPGNANDSSQFQNTKASGFFNGKIDQDSPFAYFKGKGFLETFLETSPNTFSSLFTKLLSLKGMRVSQRAPSSP